MHEIVEMILHTDDALLAIVADNTNKAYLVLFLIIFAETGLIIFPFLPGDALIFSAGVIAAASELNIILLILLLIIAAIAGNLINYLVGRLLGEKIQESSRPIVKRVFTKYMAKTHNFYERHGGKAISIGRFFPIIRTYIPFLAGMAEMRYSTFVRYTIFGAIVWVLIFALPGYFVGEIPWVKKNFGLIFIALIPILLTPLLIGLIKQRIGKKKEQRSG